MTDSRYGALEAVWESARATGLLGRVLMDELREHAAGYISPSLRLQPGARCVDLGTGVGVPGVLLAMLYPKTTWCLLDASARRCEIALEAVREAGVGDRVEVVHERADDFARQPQWRATIDLVVARLFGPPSEVAECGIPMLTEKGSLVVSVSATTANVWMSADLSPLAASVVEQWKTTSGSYIRVQRTKGRIADQLPRRAAPRRRSPLF